MRFQELKTLIIRSKDGISKDFIVSLRNRVKYSPLILSTRDLVDLKELTTDSHIWKLVSRSATLNEDDIERYLMDVVDFHTISYNQKLSNAFIKRHIKKLDIIMIAKVQNVSLDFVKRFRFKINFTLLSQNENIDIFEYEKIIREFKNKKIDWFAVSHMPLSTQFIKDFKDKLYLSAILKNKKYDDDFVLEFAEDIAKFKENLIKDNIDLDQRKLEDLVDSRIFELKNLYLENDDINETLKKFKLSESYLERHVNDFDVEKIIKYQKVSNEFIKKYRK